MGAGSVPWEGLAPFLRGFPGTAALEVGGKEEGVRQSVRRLRTLLAS